MGDKDGENVTPSTSASNPTTSNQTNTNQSIELLKLEIEKLKLENAKKSNCSDASQFVCVTHERKITKFEGHHSDTSVDDFIDEINAVLLNRKMMTTEKADFAVSYLQGQAKEEVKLRPLSERDTLEKVFNILCEAFWRDAFSPSAVTSESKKVNASGATLTPSANCINT